MSSSEDKEPFQKDGDDHHQFLPRKRKPLSKNQHLYGDDWEESSDGEAGGGSLSVSAKLPN